MKQQPFLLFEFADQGGNLNPKVFTEPERIITTNRIEEILPCLEEIERAVQSGYYAAGYLSYEAAPAFDTSFQVKSGAKMPLLWFGLFREAKQPNRIESGTFSVSEWKSAISEEHYRACIQSIKNAIENGDTYQVNYTNRLTSTIAGDEFSFYQQLSRAQASKYSAYLNIGDYSILSASPELFFRLSGRNIITKPMKGTVKRGRTIMEDEELTNWLYHSEKNRAENLMIVDLLRNDLGMIAESGSVKVEKLFEIEPYPTVLQMTSTITAKTMDETKITDVFRALFPCGSITGAPKISTMKIISELEDSPREVYCGAIGYMTPDHEAIFNVPIRTVVIDKQTGKATYGVGGGITWDSTSEDEYNEMLTKAALLTVKRPPFELLESLKLQDGEYWLLENHLMRLQSSASYFGFLVDMEEIKKALHQFATSHKKETMKVRLLVSKHGSISINGEKIIPMIDGQIVTIASSPINNLDPFFMHKTTNRKRYTYHKEQHPECFDVLLWNEDREITEFTNGNIVVELEGQLYTPPQTCGLLAGTFRAELLQNGKIKERVIKLEELPLATEIWFINSVRGWIKVSIVEK
ncbi:aminodeoxychorismate synthase component I [Bacillus sp. FJAT-49736]|uniref:aminodeoxychorismate synthase component I n=1 Tax=Bacillus sp. FJAT-49736 TaxID=2833582 RepID=UPI001BC9008B|nr:aminodeoxychorismate synthase component I [Bacillus sp. FJAT-49736]MBS4172745.1 aminodeoxychorismate synthase component I [Bacillus sp. FJAT-49736]